MPMLKRSQIHIQLKSRKVSFCLFCPTEKAQRGKKTTHLRISFIYYIMFRHGHTAANTSCIYARLTKRQFSVLNRNI